MRIAARLGDAFGNERAAWTGWPASEMLAPFATHVPVLQLRVDDTLTRRDLERTLTESGLTVTEDAGRVELWRTPPIAFGFTTSSPIGRIASWPRVYADLSRVGGRAEEAAGHLREVVMEGDGV